MSGGGPTLSPARAPARAIEALIGAVRLLDIRHRAAEDYATLIGTGTGTGPGHPAAPEEKARLDALIADEIDAQDEVMAHLRIVIGNGLLERCAGMLRHDTGGAV